MKSKTFDTLLLISLFGIAHGFFGMLYEGIVVIPAMMDTAPQRLQFWHSFYLFINPIVFYIPVVPIATILLLILYFNTPKQKIEIKKYLGRASVTQIIALVLTFYIVTQINLKLYFGNIEKYTDIIPFKILLMNILSIIRLVFSSIAVFFIFKSYTKKTHGQATCQK